MIELKIDCTNIKSSDCHETIAKAHPKVISISHIKNKHICIEKSDYDKDGHISQAIHNKCKQYMKQ